MASPIIVLWWSRTQSVITNCEDPCSFSDTILITVYCASQLKALKATRGFCVITMESLNFLHLAAFMHLTNSEVFHRLVKLG